MKVFFMVKDMFNKENSITKLIVVILLLLFIISVYLVIFKEKININNEVKLYNEDINSYVATYSVTVVSNKNINTYTMHEIFKNIDNKDCFKFSFCDVLENKVSYIVRDDYVKVSSENQLNNYIANISSVSNVNLLSSKTYLDILDNLYNTNNDICYYISDITSYDDIQDKKYSKITIILDKIKHENKCNNCSIDKLYSLGLKLSKIELILDEKGSFNIIRVYSEGLLYLELKYETMCLNEIIENNNFDM